MSMTRCRRTYGPDGSAGIRHISADIRTEGPAAQRMGTRLDLSCSPCMPSDDSEFEQELNQLGTMTNATGLFTFCDSRHRQGSLHSISNHFFTRADTIEVYVPFTELKPEGQIDLEVQVREIECFKVFQTILRQAQDHSLLLGWEGQVVLVPMCDRP